MRRKSDSVRTNVSLARTTWGDLTRTALYGLRKLVTLFGLSVASGDIQLIDGRWYVTHSGLIRLASRRRCRGISTTAVIRLCDSATNRWVFKATVYKSGPRGFVGYGDADPSTSPLWSVGPKCGWPKPGQSIARYEKPMESVSARSRSWVHCLSHSSLRNRSIPPVATDQTTVSRDSATSSAY